MKAISKTLFIIAVGLGMFLQPAGAYIMYWDCNGADPGAGTSLDGTWGTDNKWSPFLNPGNVDQGNQPTEAWRPGYNATFSAGTDAASSTYTVTVSGTHTVDSITFQDGTVTLTGGTLVLTNSSVDLQASAATLNSTIAGTNGFRMTGPGTLGTLVVGGVAVYTGETEIRTNAGALKLAVNEWIPDASPLTIGPNGMLDMDGHDETVAALKGNGIVGMGAGNLTINSGAGLSNVFGGAIVGSGHVTKLGAGTQTLTNNNGYTGHTYLKEGVLGLTPYGYVGDGTGTLFLQGGHIHFLVNRPATVLPNPVVVSANALIIANTTGTGSRILSFGGPFSGTAGSLILTNAGTIGTNVVRFYGGGFNFNRPVVLANAGTQLDIWSSNNVPAQEFSGTISGPGMVRRSCGFDGVGGTSILSGTNTYTGQTMLYGGRLGFGSDSTGLAGALTSGPIGRGVLLLGHDPEVGFFAHNGPRQVGNAMVMTSVTNLQVFGTNALTLYGNLNLGVSNRVITVHNTAPTTFSGVWNNSGPVVKAGPGTLILSGANTCSGAFTVVEGALLANNATGSGTGSGAVTVESGATLGGRGAIAGSIVLNNGAFLTAGQADGVLTCGGGLDLSSGGTYVWELHQLKDDASGVAGVDYDKVQVTSGALGLGGSSKLVLAFTNGASAPGIEDAFWLYSHKWIIAGVSGAGSNPGGAAFGSLENATFSTGSFTTSVEPDGSVALHYTSTASAAPLITAQPQSRTAAAGANVTFSVTALGNPPLTYQWYFGATPIAWGTSNAITLTNVQLAQAGSYLVDVSNGAGTTTSSNAVLTVVSDPPALAPLSGAGTANVTVRWSSANGLSYQPQFKTNLGAPSWSNLGGSVTASGPTTSVTDTNGRVPARFYRILQQP